MASRPAELRFYLDADVLGLAKVLAGLRPDVTYPGDPGGTIHRRTRPPCSIRPATKDRDWIPRVAAEGWLIVTRDRRIQEHRAELEAVRGNGARMVALSSDEARTPFGQLEVLMCQWRAIERLLLERGPFIYTATRTTLRAVDLS